MIDQRERFERAFELFEMPDPAFDRLVRRRDRKRRNQRLAAAATALLIAAGTGALLGRSWFSSQPIPLDEPTPPPGVSARFESPFYGYSIAVPDAWPDAWTVTPASSPWAWGEPRRADIVQASGPTYSFNISIASIAIPDGITEEEWQRQEGLQFRDVKAGTCNQDPTTEPIELGGVPGRIATACDGDILITLVVQGRGYVIATAGGAVASHLALFRSVIETIEFRPEQAPPVPESASGWRGLWPQTSRKEAQQAQVRADAAGSESSWQVDWNQEGTVAKRFLKEELGWDGSRESGVSYVPGDAEQAWEAEVVEWYLIRCADAPNPLYPDHPSMGDCAPTIDETHFEQVVVRAEQLIRPGRSGIWLVTGWEDVEPYEQEGSPSEAEARQLMTQFLEARLAGSGAERYVICCQHYKTVELDLYETSGGSPYVRHEITSLRGPEWPTGSFFFTIELTARDGTVVRESPYRVGPDSVNEGKVTGCCYFQISEFPP